jgi:glycosyltransferase involved in cell wall biosynthesis
MEARLSLLVLTVPRRRAGSCQRILDELERQSAGKPIELLCLYDNKMRTVGEKRNALLQMAIGDWCAFIDDDDWIAPQYVDTLLDAIDRPDTSETKKVILFDHTVQINGSPSKRCTYDVEYRYLETERLWTGRPSHTQCWRTSYARQFTYPHQDFQEDTDWVGKACAGLTVEDQVVLCCEPLYFYQYQSGVSETRGDSSWEPVQQITYWLPDYLSPGGAVRA